MSCMTALKCVLTSGTAIFCFIISTAQKYAADNNIRFIALDADDFEEIPESDNTEYEYERDFINHHAGIAKLQGDRSIWGISSDVTTLAELIKFDYFYGNS